MEDIKEGDSTSVHGDNCNHWHRKHRFGKKIFMLILFIIVFSLGIQLGELKGELHGGRHSYGMMRPYGYDNYARPGMMGFYGQNQNNWQTPTAPAPVTTPSAPIAQ